MQCPMKCVSGDHGAVRTHLAAVETQRIATNLPYTNLVGQEKKEHTLWRRYWSEALTHVPFLTHSYVTSGG